MKQIKQIISQHKSVYAAAKALKVSAVQLHRLLDADALVDKDGQVWIKSKTKLELKK
jgi:glycerol-3-phosphate responsive antiterminator